MVSHRYVAPRGFLDIMGAYEQETLHALPLGSSDRKRARRARRGGHHPRDQGAPGRHYGTSKTAHGIAGRRHDAVSASGERDGENVRPNAPPGITGSRGNASPGAFEVTSRYLPRRHCERLLWYAYRSSGQTVPDKIWH